MSEIFLFGKTSLFSRRENFVFDHSSKTSIGLFPIITKLAIFEEKIGNILSFLLKSSPNNLTRNSANFSSSSLPLPPSFFLPSSFFLNPSSTFFCPPSSFLLPPPSSSFLPPLSFLIEEKEIMLFAKISSASRK